MMEEIISIDDQITFRLFTNQIDRTQWNGRGRIDHAINFIVCLIQTKIRSTLHRSSLLQLASIISPIQKIFLVKNKIRLVQSCIRSCLIRTKFIAWREQVEQEEELFSLFDISTNSLATNQKRFKNGNRQEEVKNKTISLLSAFSLGKRTNQPVGKERKINELTRKNTLLNSGYKYCKFQYQNKNINGSPSLRLSQRRRLDLAGKMGERQILIDNESIGTKEMSHSGIENESKNLSASDLEYSFDTSNSNSKRIKWNDEITIFRPNASNSIVSSSSTNKTALQHPTTLNTSGSRLKKNSNSLFTANNSSVKLPTSPLLINVQTVITKLESSKRNEKSNKQDHENILKNHRDRKKKISSMLEGIQNDQQNGIPRSVFSL